MQLALPFAIRAKNVMVAAAEDVANAGPGTKELSGYVGFHGVDADAQDRAAGSGATVEMLRIAANDLLNAICWSRLAMPIRDCVNSF